MKRLWTGLGLLLLALTLWTGALGEGDASRAGAGDFVIEDGALIQYVGPGGDVAIPVGVTRIDDWAFGDCASVTRVSIPEGVTEIGSYAFEGCRQLAEVTFPAGVTRMGVGAFRDCASLTGAALPEGLEAIGDYAFAGCARLANVTIPRGVTAIGNYAFYGCAALQGVAIPQGVTAIGDGAFYGCAALQSVALPEGLAQMGDYVFQDCAGLVAAKLPGSLTRLRKGLFAGCRSLQRLRIPEGVTDIDPSAFRGCDGLTLQVVHGSYAEAFAAAQGLPTSVSYGIECVAIAYSGVYDGKPHGIGLEVLEPEAGAAVRFGTREGVYDQEALTFTDAGKHTVYYQVTGGGYPPLTGSAVVTILPRTVSLRWSGEKAFTYDGLAHAPAATASGLVAGDACEVSVEGAGQSVGRYVATAAALSNPNYALPEERSRSFYIKRAPVTLTWTRTTATYNGQKQYPEVTISGLAPGDACEAVFDRGHRTAGSYPVTVRGLTNDNYKLPKDATETFTIKPRTAKLTWEDTAVTYNGKKRLPRVKVANLADGDRCEVTLDKAHTNVGRYTVTATGLSNGNYRLSGEPSHSFFIRRAPVTLTWSKLNVTYNGQKQYPRVKLAGLFGEDACRAVFDSGHRTAGRYQVTVTRLTNSNYKLPKNVTETFTIKPKTVKLTWENTYIRYDGQSHKPTAIAGGLIEGDECAVTVSGSRTKPGRYTATATALSNYNYALPEQNTKKFTIAR